MEAEQAIHTATGKSSYKYEDFMNISRIGRDDEGPVMLKDLFPPQM
jgi:hypothetical protein